MPTGVNLFAAHDYYVNDVYRQRVHELMGASWVDQNSHRTLERMSGFGSAFWIDTIARIKDADSGSTLDQPIEILSWRGRVAAQQRKGWKVLQNFLANGHVSKQHELLGHCIRFLKLVHCHVVRVLRLAVQLELDLG